MQPNTLFNTFYPMGFKRLCGVAFLVLFGYAIGGSAAQSMFLQTYGSARLPHVWLLVSMGSAVAMVLINMATHKFGTARLLLIATLVSACLFALLCIAQAYQLPGSVFLLYAWKDIYIIVLVELFWTHANVMSQLQTATRTYGLYSAVGSIGSVAGSLAIAPLTESIGTVKTLWLMAPLLLLTALGNKALLKSQPPSDQLKTDQASLTTLQSSSLFDGVSLLRGNTYLCLLLFFVGLTQTVITMMDFQFNQVLESFYLVLDERTRVIGWIGAITTGLAFVLQLSTGFILKYVALSKIIISLPLTLIIFALGFATNPGFLSMALLKIVSKCIDYSLFRTVKEILYLPLTYREKTQGKALIDIFVYRSTKGCVYVLLLVLAPFGVGHFLNALNIVLCFLWLFVCIKLAQLYRQIL